jgi:hypothetical protein
MAGRQRPSFEKRQREQARLEKQAAKRARRQGGEDPGAPFESTSLTTPDGLDELVELVEPSHSDDQ